MEKDKMIFGIPVTMDDFHSSFNTIEKIRDDLAGGVVAMLGISDNSLRSNLRRANNYEADIVLIFGKIQFSDRIILKDMVRHTQISVTKDEVFDKVKEVLGITYSKELLMNYKAGKLPLDTADFLLEMYHKKGYK